MAKVALITGATRGIGKAIAIRLANAGFDIALNYRKENDDLTNTKSEIEKEKELTSQALQEVKELKESLKHQNTDVINKEKELIKKQKDELSPSYINLKNPRYMEIDGKYCSSLLVVDYSREQRDLIFKPLIDTNININMSIFYEEQDPYKVVKDLTYNIGNTAVDLEAGKNKQDIDIVEYTHDDAKYIRKQLQVNDEAFYYLYVYITIYNEDLKYLKINIDKIISILQSRGIKVRQAYFRQEQAFFSTLPLMINHKDVKEATKKNILTEGLVATYPFISTSIWVSYELIFKI